MPRYNTVDQRANVSELDPCLAAELRLKKNRFFNWKVIVAAIIILLLFIICASLLIVFLWPGSEGKVPSDQSPKFKESMSIPPIQQVPPTQYVSPTQQVSPPEKPIHVSISSPSEKLQIVNTAGKVFAICDEYFKNGFTQNGVYKLQGPTGYQFMAQCVMNESDGKSWMVMQQRTSGELPFWNRNHDEYTQGFGSPNGDHWLGLKQVRDLIEAGYILQLKVEIKGERCEEGLDHLYYTGIWKFEIDSSENDYRLHLSDMLKGNFTQPLFTMDDSKELQFNTANQTNGNQENCLDKLHLGGWWTFKNGCSFISLNGEYTCEKKGTLFGLSVYSRTPLQQGTLKFNNIRPKSTRMMLRVCNGEEKCT